VLRKRTPENHNSIATCLDEKAKPPKGGGAKQQGLPLSSLSQDSLLPNQQSVPSLLTVRLADHPAVERLFRSLGVAGSGTSQNGGNEA